MTAQILDGKATATDIRREIAATVRGLPRRPGLATVLVGDDPGSSVYVRNKHRACDEVGFHSVDVRLPSQISTEALLDEIDRLNSDTDIDGFIVQLPLPDSIDRQQILVAVDPDKDADGLHPLNLGRLVLGDPGPLPCTPNGIVVLGERFGVEWSGAHVVVVGRGTTVGRPLGLLLTLKGVDATVTLTHSRTQDLASFTRAADVVVSAVGRPSTITADMIADGAVVFDVGISRTDSGISGDADPTVRDKASWLAPVPGGVGPMTVAMLLRNTLQASVRVQSIAKVSK